MKKYISPEFEIEKIDANDIITTSLGTETPKEDEKDGIWEFGINP